MSVVEALEGDWKQTSSENFGIFLKAIGVGDQAAARADIQPHSQKWAVEGGGKVKLTRRNSTTSVTTDFKLGEPVEETLLEGCASTKCTFDVDGDKVISKGDFNGVPCVSKWYLVDGKLQMEFYAENKPETVAVKKFEKAE